MQKAKHDTLNQVNKNYHQSSTQKQTLRTLFYRPKKIINPFYDAQIGFIVYLCAAKLHRQA